MAQQVELRRLRLRGSGAIVLTASSVCHQNKKAFFGSRSTTVPLHSITGLYVGWERSRIVLFFCGLGFAGWIGTKDAEGFCTFLSEILRPDYKGQI